MALFGGHKFTRGGSLHSRSQGVSPAVRAARARAGHKRRASHLFVANRAKGRATTYRRGRGHLF